MARQARTPSETGYYHVMVRGNNKEAIFIEKSYKAKYISLFLENIIENNVKIVAWCIMKNHAHLILKSNFTCLKETMSSVNTKFAMVYNYVNNRVGHVFQGRYKSQNIEKDEYLINVIRYVHNNPIKAGIVSDISDYEWSSYNEYLSKPSYICNEQRGFVMSYFNSDISRFEDFHKITDINVYLDTKEDKEFFQINHAQKVLSNFCKTNGVSNAKQVYYDRMLLEQLITKLLMETSLSHRKIAKLIGIDRYIVHNVNQKLKKLT